jgi:hypothetical protein
MAFDISCREEDSVLHGVVGGQPNSETPAAERKNWEDSIPRRYPLVEWWDLNPENGEFVRETCRVGVPELLQTAEEVLHVNWRFRPDGQVETITLKDKPGHQADEVKDKKAASFPPQCWRRIFLHPRQGCAQRRWDLRVLFLLLCEPPFPRRPLR